LGRCPDGGRVMRNHGSIHLFIAGMIAVFLDVHTPTMLAEAAVVRGFTDVLPFNAWGILLF